MPRSPRRAPSNPAALTVGHAAGHVHLRALPVLAPVPHRARRSSRCSRRPRTRASPARASSWRWRSPATRCRWRTATSQALVDMGVDYVLVPNMLDAEAHEASSCTAHFCPWNQTLPYVLRSAPRLEEHGAQVPGADAAFPAWAASRSRRRWPRWRGGWACSRRASDRAVDAAYAAQREFQERLLEAGRARARRARRDRRARASCWSAAATTSTTAASTATSRASCGTATAPTSSRSTSW